MVMRFAANRSFIQKVHNSRTLLEANSAGEFRFAVKQVEIVFAARIHLFRFQTQFPDLINPCEEVNND